MSRLPNSEHAIVTEDKCRRYLLDVSHPTGGPKARFFRAHGFTSDRWPVLRQALLAHPAENEVVASRPLERGGPRARTNYEVRCTFRVPGRRHVCIRTIWSIREGEAVPRFITAYPADTKAR